MFGLAWLAPVRPAYDDWLNERSSTPPTSSTMQALKALPPPLAEPPEPALSDGLLLHAAASVAIAATAIVTVIALRKGVSFGLSHECPECRGDGLGSVA